MKKINMFLCFLVILGSFSLISANSAAAGPEVRIWKNVQALLNRGKLHKACELTEKLWPYKDTPTYDKAKVALQKQGISIGDPLGSLTLMRIVALQNKLEDYRAKTGRIPAPGPRKKFEDGWYKPIRVEIITRKSFAYMLRAAGRDGKWMTNDDYVIGVRHKAAKTLRTEVNALGKEARGKGKSSMFVGKGGKKSIGLPGADLSSGAGVSSIGSKSNGARVTKKPKPANSGEKSVTLDDLLKQ